MSGSTSDENAEAGPSSGEGRSRRRSLAQRARSFKKNFLGFFSHMRFPRSSGAHPKAPSTPTKDDDSPDSVELSEDEDFARSLESNVRQARFALSHFRNVIKRNLFQVLPGNGTILLEIVIDIQTLLIRRVRRELSSALVLASQDVHESVADLIKFCDDYLLTGEEVFFTEGIIELIADAESNMQYWVALIRKELGLRDPGGIGPAALPIVLPSRRVRAWPERSGLIFRQNSLRSAPNPTSQRESPESTTDAGIEKEPENLDVLSESPPPKPPLPERANSNKMIPPPLPPKKRKLESAAKRAQDRLRMKSKSPEGSTSLLSASTDSLDSILNQPRVNEDELRMLAESPHVANQVDEGLSPKLSRQEDPRPTFDWENTSEIAGAIVTTSSASDLVDSAATAADNSLAKLMDRLSGSQAESGFGSILSRRSSSQSYSAFSQQLSSTRSSQQSYSSQESYQTEKRLLSPDASSPSKVSSIVAESEATIASIGASFEELSLEKRSPSRKTSEICSSEYDASTSTRTTFTQVSSEELKIEESHFLSSSLSSTSFSSHYFTPSYFSRESAIKSSEDHDPPTLPVKKRNKFTERRQQAMRAHQQRSFQTGESSQESNYVVAYTQTEEEIVAIEEESVAIEEEGVAIEEEDVKIEEEGAAIEEENIGASLTIDMEDSGSVAGAMPSDAGDDSTTESQISQDSKDKGIQTDAQDMALMRSKLFLDLTPPPLPPKKRPIMAYMEMFGNASHPTSEEFLRHSVHAYKMLQNEWQKYQGQLSIANSFFNYSTDSNPSTPVRKPVAKASNPSVPPALPPKKSKRKPSTTDSAVMPQQDDSHSTERNAPSSSSKEVAAYSVTKYNSNEANVRTPPYLDSPLGSGEERKPYEFFLNSDVPVIESLDALPHMQLKKVVRGVYVVKGGSVDALIAHAANSHETDYMYEEAFIMTYRTFITPLELFQKLVHRYDKLYASQYEDKQKASKNTFDFIVRTADSLTLLDLDHDLVRTLMDLVHRVVRRGGLNMGASLRNIIIQRCELKKLYNSMKSIVAPRSSTTRASLFDFKSEQIAEQMTMMDAELFLRIESPEILTWAQDQREELSPNLSRFTVHFNKMSYWTRSRILEQRDSRSRERYLLKFVKIMKHLRKINNFNSCLALLSALDSAPVRRLDWQKNVMEGIQEHSDLIDSSSSFRAYRQALADSQPPCIPYIGLVLQDLTFINAGNPNLLPDGSINFSKRWQQYDVIQNMARFKIGLYNYRKNEKIIKFFNDFDDALSEEEMWQLSEKLKPRPSKNK